MAALATAGWLALGMGPGLADRHCSHGVERLFYAGAFATEALAGAPGACAAKLGAALERLRAAQQQFEICSCGTADAALAGWLKGAAAETPEATDAAACLDGARAVQRLVKRVTPMGDLCY